jgi:hypothetical protein
VIKIIFYNRRSGRENPPSRYKTNKAFGMKDKGIKYCERLG